MIKATYANADNPMAQMIIRVDADDLRFYVFEMWDAGLVVASSKRATVDLQRLLTRSEWEEEYGGLATWDELTEAISNAYKVGAQS